MIPSPQEPVSTEEQLKSIESRITELSASFNTMSQTVAINMKQNIEMMRSINEYISEQMSYRLYRQNLEENNINLQLQQKAIELQFMQKKFDALSAEKQEDDAEAQDLKIEREKLKLEVETLKKNLDSLQENKQSTKDRVKTIKVNSVEDKHDKIIDTVTMTALGTLTAIGVTGVVAFILFLVRLYIQSSP